MTDEKIIRTKTRAEGGITDDEREQMKVHTDMWIKRALYTGHIEPDKIVPAIKGLYAAADLAEPVVAIAPSPLVMAYAFGAASALLERDDPVTELYYNWETNAVSSVVSAALREVDPAVAWEAYNETNSANPNIEADAREACIAIAGQGGLDNAREWRRVVQGGNMWAGWDCYLTAARDILGLDLPAHEKYKSWELAAIHGGFRVMHEKFCIVSDFPEFIKMDEENRPHCEDGPSHRWRDGWELYHWRGVRVPSEWITDKESLSVEIALTHENLEMRRAASEIVGWELVLQKLGAVSIHKDPDEQIGELVEVDLPDVGKARFLRVTCATGRKFALCVPEEMQTALQANAWTYNVPEGIISNLDGRT